MEELKSAWQDRSADASPLSATAAVSEVALPLLQRLQKLVECGAVQEYVCIIARHEHGASSVRIEQPALAVVLHGSKQMRGQGFHYDIQRGECFVITRACQFDVVNSPSLDNGLYLTLMLPLCPEVIQAARLLLPELPSQQGLDVITIPLPTLETALTRWYEALLANRYSEARLALTALLLQLCEQGHSQVLAPTPPSVAAQIRALVAAQPAREWRSSDFETALGLSGATLRRRLANEQTSLLHTVTEARLVHAMNLLYTTRWPVKTVAARVGYRSATSFVRRFVERYGIEPSQIGNSSDTAD